MKFAMTKMAAALVLAGASTVALAVPVSTGGVFQMNVNEGFDRAVAAGSPVNTDATITGFVDQAAGTWGVASTAPFFGFNWTASNGQLITNAGNYSLNTLTGVVTAGTGLEPNTNDGTINFTVAAGQIAGKIDFAWQTSSGIRVVDIWNVNPDGSLTAVRAPGMENGPFPGYNARFTLTAPGLYSTATAPIPEASTYGMMLAGLGLVGGMVARRRKLMA